MTDLSDQLGALTASEALAIEIAEGRTVIEMIGGWPRCARCDGRPPIGFACLHCGARRPS